MCARCHRRVAVVFITRMEQNQTVNEGLCLKCAKEIGIKPVSDLMSKMGLSEDDIESMTADIGEMAQNLPEATDDGEDGGAPAIDLPKIFQNLGFPMPGKRPEQKKSGEDKGGQKGEKKEQKRKFLSTYCTDLTRRAREGKLDRIIGRDRELERVIQILCRRQKNNPCLIGEPGIDHTHQRRESQQYDL